MFRFRPGILAATTLVLAFPAIASPAVIVTYDQHNTAACVYAEDLCDYSSAANVGAFASVLLVEGSDGNATAALLSYVGATVGGVTSFGATASATATAFDHVGEGYHWAQGGSDFGFMFLLSEAYTYALTASLESVTTDPDTTHSAVYHLSLYDYANATYVASTYREGNAADLLAQSGILAPGDYWIGAGAFANAYSALGDAGGSSAARLSFTLALTPVAGASVPEPSTMLLFGTALLTSGLRRWRKKRS